LECRKGKLGKGWESKMQLLYNREQVSGARAPKFKLMAKIELDEQEKAIVAHYRLDKAMLIERFEPVLMKFAAYAAGAGFASGFIFFLLIMGWRSALFMGLVCAGGAGWYVWNKYRETIFVSDLIQGRHFQCRSVVELAKKEAYLSNIVIMLRQVMESARHWHGTQSEPIAVLPPDEAKRLIVEFG